MPAPEAAAIPSPVTTNHDPAAGGGADRIEAMIPSDPLNSSCSRNNSCSQNSSVLRPRRRSRFGTTRIFCSSFPFASLPPGCRPSREVHGSIGLARQPFQSLLAQLVWYALVFGSLYGLLQVRYHQPFWRSLGWRFPFRGWVGPSSAARAWPSRSPSWVTHC